LYANYSEEEEEEKGLQGVKLTFIPGSHLDPKYFKVVANSKKVGGHYDTRKETIFTL